MIAKQLELTNEQTSPLFRIMSIYNANTSNRKQFSNNICAFHIGNGYILSVAHNLRTEANFLNAIPNENFNGEILPHLNAAQIQLFHQCYQFDSETNKWIANTSNQNEIVAITEMLKQINFDTRWVTLAQKNICNPYLIVQFKNNQFYNDPVVTAHFDTNSYFSEPGINRHTFLIETELVHAFYHEDIALYKIVNTHQVIIDKLPSIEINFSLLSDEQKNYYCLQSSPNSEVGRLINKATIEGFIDHFGFFNDRVGGNYTFEGIRYLIKGYFRFGSSGAPYVVYDWESDSFKVNAVQSEACPIQLSINNQRDGNFQYVNAIASPLNCIEDKLRTLMTGV
ncbi:MAG: hypothetical protein V4648_01430 [Bacteroidota bacterium]